MHHVQFDINMAANFLKKLPGLDARIAVESSISVQVTLFISVLHSLRGILYPFNVDTSALTDIQWTFCEKTKIHI